MFTKKLQAMVHSLFLAITNLSVVSPDRRDLFCLGKTSNTNLFCLGKTSDTNLFCLDKTRKLNTSAITNHQSGKLMMHQRKPQFQRISMAISAAVLLASCAHEKTDAPMSATEPPKTQSMSATYPSFTKSTAVDTYGGTRVADPYRGLEEIDSEETKAWVVAQNEVTQSHLETLPARESLKTRMTELWNYEKFSIPFSEGGRWFISQNSGVQNQAVLYTMPDPSAAPKVLLDPNTLSSDGTMALNSLSVSPNGKLLAYAVSSGGSDWQTWYVREIETGKDLQDKIEWSKFSGATWLPDSSGFYFGAFDKPEGENALKAANIFRLFSSRYLKLARHRNYLIFLLRCRDHAIMPIWVSEWKRKEKI